MKTLPHVRPAATRNSLRPAPRDAVTALVELIEAETRDLPPGPRNKLLRKLAAVAERELDETGRRRYSPDIGSSMSTNPEVGLPSELQGMYYLG